MPENTEVQQVQPPELPPAFIQLIKQVREARKTLLKDPAYLQAAQLRQFLAQYVLPLFEQSTKLFGSAFVDTYMLAAADHEEIARINETLDERDGGIDVDLDDLNDLQKAFYALGSVVEAKNDPETKAAYDACATSLTEFIGIVMEDARANGAYHREDGDEEDDGDRPDGPIGEPFDTEDEPPTEEV